MARDAAGARRDPADYELLPVHPWQLRRILPDRYADALARGRLIAIPGAQIRARPLLSLRTLAPAAIYSLGQHIQSIVFADLRIAVDDIFAD